jgi:tetratricopeptide (TPR) repeat protein
MGIYLQVEDWNKAIAELERLSQVELKDNRYTKVLARLYEKQGNLDLACKRALTAVYINPYDLAAHQLLLQLDQKAGNTAGADRESRVIPILKAWLAQSHDDQGDGQRAPPPTAQ